MENAHLSSADQVAKNLNVDFSKGLTSAEAEERLRKYGPNETPEPPKTPYWKLILSQFKDTLVQILCVSAAVSFGLSALEGDYSVHAFVEPCVIITILVLNAVVGVWQESNAESAIDALKSYAAPSANVLRDGSLKQIPAREVVPGDVVQVNVGDQVPADIRLVQMQSTTLRIDQSVLTGESEPVMKFPEVLHAEDCGRWPINTLYAGTSVSYGKGRGIAAATGTHTEYGKIERSMREEEDVQSPLKRKLDEFGDQLTKVIAVICVMVWLVNAPNFAEHGSIFKGAIYYLKISIALAVAAIPEGLPAVVTTCLALGTRKMAKLNCLIRSLPSVETLGCTTVICSDKTGTLTTNMMSVAKVCFFSNNVLEEFDVDDTKFNVADNTIKRQGASLSTPIPSYPMFEEVAKVCTLCNDSSLDYDAKTQQVLRVGEATEAALRVLAEKIGLATPCVSATPAERCQESRKFWEDRFVKKNTLEFTRDRKSMSVFAKAGNQGYLFVKGAPENILDRCTEILVSKGKAVPITQKHREDFYRKLKEYSTGHNSLRCIGLAYRVYPSDPAGMDDPKNFAKIESGLTFVGVVGMLDPPRQEVKSAIQRCNRAGIRVIVITGDNKDTAEAICKKIGIFEEHENTAGKAFTGAEFTAMNEEEQLLAMQRVRLFARTDPAMKMHIVKLLQQLKCVTAMTGDGVNDAPALKKADIGIAMGSGTEVAKAASKMILSDDNFSSIVASVEQGRAIYNNTKQFIRYLISSNIGEVVCIFITALCGLPEALVPVQLLWVNLVTDGLPATALGFNPPDPDIMEKAPRKSDEPIVNGWLFARYVTIGAYVGLATVFAAIWYYMYDPTGPGLSFDDMQKFHTCLVGSSRVSSLGHEYSCGVFANNIASSMSLSVLVTVEMFNALNSLSENQSILSISPFQNVWLLLAIAMSFALHFAVLYIPVMANIFQVVPLDWFHWKAVIVFSAPVVIVDEALKFIARVSSRNNKLKIE